MIKLVPLLLQSYGMNFDELADELNRSTSKKERKTIQSGDVISCLGESHALAQMIYNAAKDGDDLHYAYSYRHNPIVFD